MRTAKIHPVYLFIVNVNIKSLYKNVMANLKMYAFLVNDGIFSQQNSVMANELTFKINKLKTKEFNYVSFDRIG